MRRAQISLLAVVGAVAAAMSLAACERVGDEAGTQPSQPGAQQPERRAEAPMPSGPGMSSGTERSGQPQAGAAAGDAKVVADVKTALARDPDLGGQDIEVKATEGKVSLSGSVTTAQASERATQVASTVVGVRAVENQLTVKGRG